MEAITRGDTVLVTTADKREIPRIAITEVIKGHSFPVVWVCTSVEWHNAIQDGRAPSGVPWPAENVRAFAP